MGFRTGAAIANTDINGNPSSPAAKWSDASSIQSGLGCMNPLGDWDGVIVMASHAVPTLNKTVTVRSKRDASNLYMDFEVLDQTQNRGDPGHVGEQLPLGERIVIQIDPDHSRGGALGAGPGASQFDYRIELAHTWGVGGFTDTKFKQSTAAAGTTVCGVQDWADTGSFPATIKAALGTSTLAGGYVVELKIPLNQIGNPGGDIGIAFAVVNDLGYLGSGTADATGIAFPATMALTNGSNPGLVDPADPAGCGDWVTPNTWGGGYFNTAPTDVTISRNPIWWSSDAIVGLECGVIGYDYFPGIPCKLTLNATLDNTGSAPAVRNLLFLFGNNDTGVSRWTFMDLQKGISVPNGGPPGPRTFLSASFNPPAGLANHPCVRVYILPAAFRGDFDEATIRALNLADSTVISDMETKYGLSTQHWAQKNITRRTDVLNCPNAGCNIGLLLPQPYLIASLTFPGEAPSLVGTGTGAWVPSSDAAGAVPAEPPQKPDPGGPGSAANILMPAKELAAFRNDNVIVQIRSFGFSKVGGAKRPAYNFIEPIGGIQHLIPVAMIKNGVVHIQFDMTNPGKVPRTIFLKVDTLVPQGFGPVTVIIDGAPQDYGPGETKTVKGTVGLGSSPTTNNSKFAVFADLGAAIPNGTLSNVVNTGVSFNAGLEYILNTHISAEGILGVHHFPGKIAGDVTAIQFTGGAKAYLTNSPNRLFIRAGLGGYHFTSGTTNFGGYTGGGLLHEFNTHFGLEGVYTFHAVNTPGAATKFSTVQGGVRYAF
jgi:hypothetical protein